MAFLLQEMQVSCQIVVPMPFVREISRSRHLVFKVTPIVLIQVTLATRDSLFKLEQRWVDRKIQRVRCQRPWKFAQRAEPSGIS